MQSLIKSRFTTSNIKKLVTTRRYIPNMNPFDLNFKCLIYLRYTYNFVMLVISSIDKVKHIKYQVVDILNKNCELELHKDKIIITTTKDGFKFLGAWYKRILATKASLSKNKARNPAKYHIRIEIPIKDLIAKLKINKFILTDSNGIPTATARKDLINFSHYEIVTFYNHYITGLLNFYSFAANLSSL